MLLIGKQEKRIKNNQKQINMDEFQEQVILTNTHSLIFSNIPDKFELKPEVGTSSVMEINKFGLFSDSPSFNNYYPDATPEDVQPKDGEFIQPLFRMLSNTVVISNRGLIEFPADVLKASISKLPGQALYPNHDSQIGNELGVITDTVWQDSYKVRDITIPAGINGRVKIDAKANPRVARGLMMNPPSIHSVSCTVVYKWVKSHPDMDDSKFYNLMGTYDDKGNLVRKVATNILYYTELSLVSGGADPFAKKLDKDGKIILPSFAKEQSVETTTNLSYSHDWANVKLYYDKESFSKFNNNEKQEQMNEKEIIELVGTLLGLQGVTKDNLKAELESFVSKKNNLVEPASLEIGDIKGWDKVKESFEAMKTELETLRPLKEKESFIKAGEDHLKEVREEAVKFYKLTLKEGQAEDENIVNLINSSNLDQAVAMKKQYQESADEKVPLTCTECGSHNISRASSKKEDEGGSNDKAAMSYEDIRERLVDKTYLGIKDSK